jgi:hypothetical protein
MSVTSATTTATSDPSQGYSHPPITKWHKESDSKNK